MLGDVLAKHAVELRGRAVSVDVSHLVRRRQPRGQPFRPSALGNSRAPLFVISPRSACCAVPRTALEQPEGERTTMDLEEHPVSACNPSPTLG